MAFVPENPLEEALVKAASGDALAAPTFYRALVQSQLHVIGDVGRPAGGKPVTALPGDKLNIANMRNKGRNYHPIFSSLARLHAFNAAETPYFSIPGRGLFETARGANFVLNPGSEYGKELLAGEIDFWLDPAAVGRPLTPEQQKQVLLGQPVVYPDKLVAVLKILFAARSNVVAAHLLQIAFADRDEPPHPLIGIEVEGGWRKIAVEVSEVAAAALADTLFDLVRIDPADLRGLAAKLRDTPPFYTRSKSD